MSTLKSAGWRLTGSATVGSMAAAGLADGLSSAGGPDGLAADGAVALPVQPTQTSVAARVMNNVCGFMTSPQSPGASFTASQ